MATHRRRKRRRLRPFFKLVLFTLFVLCVTIFVRWSNTTLDVTHFDPVFPNLPEGFDGYRVVVLSDLHGAEFGDDNQTLFRSVAKQEPEYIFYLGDLQDRYRGQVDGFAESIAQGLSAIAPTYYVTGNHEWAIGDVPELKETLSNYGVTVLSNTFLTLERNKDSIILAGIDDPNGYADQKTPQELAAEVYEAHDDPFWFLLAHRNNRFVDEYSLLGADLVCSGHGHGGIIRLPFTDGLLSVERTFFPSYTSGLYQEHNSLLFVTRGLGNSGASFRLLNRPEIAVLTLHKGYYATFDKNDKG